MKIKQKEYTRVYGCVLTNNPMIMNPQLKKNPLTIINNYINKRLIHIIQGIIFFVKKLKNIVGYSEENY